MKSMMKSGLKYIAAVLLSLWICGLQAETLPNLRFDETGRYEIEFLSAPIIKPNNEACPGTTSENNSYGGKVEYTKVDTSGDFPTSSSSVTLSDFQLGTCAWIKYAYLYWGGATDSGSGTWDKAIKMKLPDETLHDITPVYYSGTAYGSANNYLCVADVSSLFADKNPHNMQGKFTVGEIEVSLGGADGGNTGGWALALIYESNDYTRKLLKMWDGPRAMNNETVTLDMNGLTGVPASGTVDAFLGLITFDGDQGKKDYLTLRSNTTSDFDLGAYEGSADNFLRSTISSNSPATRVYDPSCADNKTLGWDAHHLKLPNGSDPAVNGGLPAIGFDATSAQLVVRTEDTQMLLVMNYIAIETNEPNLVIAKDINSDKSNLAIDPDDLTKTEITYTVTVTNEGKVPSYKRGEAGSTITTITDPLPPGVEMIPVDPSDLSKGYKLEALFFDAAGEPIDKDMATIDFCYRYDPVTNLLTIEYGESLDVNEYFEIDLYTRLRPYESACWRNVCNRVIKNIASLEFAVNNTGATETPNSAACSPDADLDAISDIETAWDEGDGEKPFSQIDDILINDNPIVSTINAVLQDANGPYYEVETFDIYWCNDPLGDCTWAPDNSDGQGGLTKVQPTETFNDAVNANMLFVAYHQFGSDVFGNICSSTYIIRPKPSAPSFKFEIPAGKDEVSCNVNDIVTDENLKKNGAIDFFVKTQGQLATFNYELRNNTTDAVVASGSFNDNNDDFEGIINTDFSALPPGTYYIYISDLRYTNMPTDASGNQIPESGYLKSVVNSDETVISSLETNKANATLHEIKQPAPLVWNTPAIVANNTQSCINDGDIIELTASATGGTGAITYDWTATNGGTVSGTDNSLLTHTPTERGDFTYKVVAICENSCKSAETSIVIQVRNVPEFTIAGLDKTFCSDAGPAVARIEPVGENVTYTWASTNPLHTNLPAGNSCSLPLSRDNTGTFTITATGTQDFCTREIKTDLQVEKRVEIADFTLTKDGVVVDLSTTTFDGGEVVTITANANGDTPNLEYAWMVDGKPYGGNNATIELVLSHTVDFSVTVTNRPSLAESCDAVLGGTLPVCKANISMSDITINRCADNGEPLRFTAIKDQLSSEIKTYEFKIYQGLTSIPEFDRENQTGVFIWTADELRGLGTGEFRAVITAIPECDASSPARRDTEEVALNIFDAVSIDPGYPLLNSNSVETLEIKLGEALRIEVSPYDPLQHQYIINNDVWTLGSMYIDYPVNDKTYEVVLKNNEYCSDTKTVKVKVAALPTAVLSSENANFDQYLANNVNKGIAVIGNFTVFNRYGQEMFNKSGEVFWAGWDNDEKQLAPGTYFYVYTTPKGQVKRGTVEVVK